MRKWLVALMVLTISAALCMGLWLGGAVAEEGQNTFVTVTNGTLADGAYTGSYYYRVDLSSVPDDIQIGMGYGPINGDEPYGWDFRVVPVNALSGTSGHRYILAFPEAGKENPTDALFLKMDQRDDEWTRLVFAYDTTKKGAPKATVTSTGAPELNDDYTISWTAVSGAEAYKVYWKAANGEVYSATADGNSTSMKLSELAERMWNDDFAEMTRFPGACETWVDTYKNSEIGEGTHKTIQIAAHENGADEGRHIYLTSDRIEAEGSDGTTYYDTQVHEDVWFTVTADEYVRGRMKNLIFVNGEYSDMLSAWDMNQAGRVDTKWVPQSDNWTAGETQRNYTVYAAALVQDGEDEIWIYSDPKTVRVSMGAAGFTGADIDYYTEPAPPTEGPGMIEVAQDSHLAVYVNNIQDQAKNNLADFYGCRIEENGDVIADSNWVTVEPGNYTEVWMPMVGTEPGKTYEAQVYAVKIGGPIVYAEDSITLKAGKKTGNNPIDLQMKLTYQTDERIRIYANYDNAERLNEENSWIHLRVYKEGEDDPIFEMDGDGFSLWEDHLRINEPGSYTAEVMIREDQGNWQPNEIDETRTTYDFEVYGGNGTLSAPTITLGTTHAETGTKLPITMGGSTYGTGDDKVNAERYTFRVYRYGEDNRIDYSDAIRESFSNGAGTLYIDTDVLGIGKYEVEAEATAKGYLPGKASKTFTVRKKPELSIIRGYTLDNQGRYIIPTHTDFTVRINAYGADHVELDLDKGWDREPIYLEEYEQWWDGSWGENHEDIELTLQYDESCANVEGSDTFPMTVRARYEFDGENDPSINSESLTVISTREGKVNVSSWEPAKYWKTRENGDVDVSFWKENDSWIDSSVNGISIARGKNLNIYLGTAKDKDRPDGCVDFSGFLLPNNQFWDMYDGGEPDEFGWLTLNTAKFGNENSNANITGYLRLYAWKTGWDSNYKEYPITITNTQVTTGANWLFNGADANGNLTVQTNEGISFSVYVPGANEIQVIATDKNGDEVLHDSWGRDFYATPGWGMDSGAELTFKAVAEFVDQNGVTTKETYTYPGTITITSQGPLPAPTVTLTNATNYIQKGQNAGFTVTENSAVFQNGTSGAYKDEYKDIEYNAYLWDEEWRNIGHIDRLKLTETHSFSFATNDLQEGRFYHITVDIQQKGWTGRANETVFAVVSSDAGSNAKAITLKVDGTEITQNGAVVEKPSSQRVRVEVNAPEATAVRVLEGNRSEFWFGNDSYYRDWSFGNDTILAAMATYDPLPEGIGEDGWDWNRWNWDSLNWTGVSKTAEVHITNTGDMPEPVWHIEKKTGENEWTTVSKENLSIAQGTELRIVYDLEHTEFPTGFDAAYWGFTDIEKQEGNRWGTWWNYSEYEWEWKKQADNKTAITEINTYVYDPGHYRLRVGLDAAGWNGEAEEIEFDISENNALEPACLILSRDSMKVGDNVQINAYAPNAEWMEVEIRWDREGNENWRDGRNGGGERGKWDWGCGCSGEYTFTLHAYRGNQHFTDSKTLTVTKDGTLENPTINNVPHMIEMGTGINGSFTAVSGAEDYYIQLKYQPEGGEEEQVFEKDRQAGDASTRTLTFSGEMLNKAGRYKLSVSANKYGYEHGYREQDIYVLPGSQDNVETHAIVLKVNGETLADGSTMNWPSSKGLKVKVEAAPGAERPTAVRVLNGDRWEFWSRNDNNWEREWGFGESTELVAMATYTPLPENFDEDGWDWNRWDWEKDVAWTAVSNIVHLNIENEGDMPEPKYHLEIDRGNGWQGISTTNLSVLQGEKLRVVYHINGDDAIVFPTGFSGDYWGFVNIERQESNRWGTWWNGTEYDWHWDGSSKSVTIETIVYEPGRYRMHVGLDAEGWRGKDKEFEFNIERNVWLPEADLLLSKDEMKVGDNVEILAYAPGAERMRVDMTWKQDGWTMNNWQWSREAYGEDTARWDWGCGEHGEYTIKMSVYYPKGSEKEDTTVTKTLTVTTISETEILPDVMIQGIDVVNWTGNNINGSFVIHMEEGGIAYATPDSYQVRLEYWPDYGEGEEIYKDERKPGDDGLTTLAFDKNMVSRPGMYYLQVEAEKYGYDHGYDDLVFIVLPTPPEQSTLTLKVNGGTENVTGWRLYEPLKDVDVVTPDGVTAVRIWKRNHFEYFAGNRRYNDGDWSFEAGVWTMVAQATTDTRISAWLDEHGDMDQFDWNSVNWSLTSNSLTVGVTKTGDLVDPTVKYENSAWPEGGVTVTRGNALTFKIGTVDNCDYCGIKVRKASAGDGEWLVDTDLGYTEETSVSIPTDGFSEGDYQLVIDPRRYGYQGNEKYYAFTVTEPEGWNNQQARFTASKTNVQTKEPVTFSIYAPGAERVKLCYASENNVWQETEGEILVGNVQMNWVRNYDVYAYALYPDGDGWTQIGNTATIIHVTAPNGTLEFTNVSAPETIKANQNLDVTMSCNIGQVDGYFECWLTDVNNRDYEFHSLVEEDPDANGVTTETFRIDGGTLQPGVYILSGYAFSSKMGWAIGHFDRTITVTAENETAGDLQLQLGKTEAQTGDDVGIMAYAKNATHVKVEVIFPEDAAVGEVWEYEVFEKNGDTLMESAFMGEVACTVTVKLTATYESGNPKTLTKTITIGTPKGKLNPTIRLNRAWTAGSGLDFTVDIGKSDAQYVVKVREKGLTDACYFEFQRGNSGKDCYVQPTEFVPGKTYEIEVIAAGSGYGRGEAKLTLRCRKAAPTTMRLPGGLKTIEAEAFEGVIAERIIVPAGVTTIGSKAFANCTRLTEIELPSGITSFSADAFYGCGTIVLYGKEGSYLEGYANNCANLVFVQVP